VVGFGVAFTGLMGFAHTKPGRPVLTWMGMAAPKAAKGACPFGYGAEGSTVEQKTAASKAFAAKHAGTESAAGLPALGFELGRTTRADVDAWAKSFDIACKHPRSGGDLECTKVPTSALPEGIRGGAVTSLWMTFGANDALTQLGVLRHAEVADEASTTFQSVVSDIEKRAGSETKPTLKGDGTASMLLQGILSQSSAEFRYRNYYAVVRTTNMGNYFSVTEDYRFLPG
jgi:hypothetical protein